MKRLNIRLPKHMYEPEYYINEKRKLMYFENPKVASTSFKIMLGLRPTVPMLQTDSLYSTENSGRFFTREEIRQARRLAQYDTCVLHRDSPSSRPDQWSWIYSTIPDSLFKFGFVRNPYTRLFSFFQMAQMYRLWRMHSPLEGRGFEEYEDLSFKELIHLLPKGQIRFDRHLMQQSISIPTEVTKIDFIGKLENFENDCKRLKEAIGNGFDFQIVKRAPSDTHPFFVDKRKEVEEVKKRLKEQHPKNMKRADLDAIYELYEKDFQLFGYDYEI
jgi:hypothetical protein